MQAAAAKRLVSLPTCLHMHIRTLARMYTHTVKLHLFVNLQRSQAQYAQACKNMNRPMFLPLMQQGLAALV